MPVWENNQTELFVQKKDDEYPQYLYNVLEIDIVDKIEGRIIVKFYMPSHSWKGIENDCTLFIMVLGTGLIPDVFTNGKPFAICRNCRVVEIFSEDVKTSSLSNAKIIDITMTIECDIELMPVEGIDKTE